MMVTRNHGRGLRTAVVVTGMIIATLILPGGDAWVLAGRWKGSVWDPDEVGPVEPYLISTEVMTPVE